MFLFSHIFTLQGEKLELEAKVVKEANKYLYPYYQDKCFTKPVYKEIMEKIVRKVANDYKKDGLISNLMIFLLF